MQFSARQDVTLTNYSARSSLLTVFKHGLREGSTILLQYKAITRTPLESSPSGEFKYAISPGYNVRPKNKSIRKCKNDIARRACMVTALWTGSDRFGQVRTGWDRFGQVWTSPNKCAALFFLHRELHTVQIWPTPKPACSFLTVPRSKHYDPPKWWKQRFVMLQLA